ncbi:hypothetical protein, partial [Microbacterium esteraromaticum]|uniref:hypothetical protein n=1 Tax=Microbacterium esteraromaticum TaxID=57043 RepID=UPI001C4E3752
SPRHRAQPPQTHLNSEEPVKVITPDSGREKVGFLPVRRLLPRGHSRLPDQLPIVPAGVP